MNGGDGVTIENCTFNNVWYAVYCGNWTDDANHRIVGNTFKNCTASAVYFKYGSGHQVYGNDFSKKNNPSSTFRAIQVDPAPSGAWSAHVDFSGNYVRGFGSGMLGIYGETGDPLYTSTPGPSMQSEYVDSNYGD